MNTFQTFQTLAFILNVFLASSYGFAEEAEKDMRPVPAERPAPLEDPIGLGERLVLIDFLQGRGFELGPNPSLAELRKQYWSLVEAPSNEAAQEAAAERDAKSRLAHYLKQHHNIDTDNNSTLKELQEKRRVADLKRQDDYSVTIFEPLEKSSNTSNDKEQKSAENKTQNQQLIGPDGTLNIKPLRYQFPSTYTRWADQIPDLYQASRKAGLADGGTMHCAPSAVSNSLMWFAQNGYPDLAFGKPGQARAHYEIAQRLSSVTYMNTDNDRGTFDQNILKGVDRFVKDQGYRYKSLKYQGRHIPPYNSEFRIPEIGFLKSELSNKGAVWLAVRYCRYYEEHDLYIPYAGHLVTLVGYGVERNGSHNPNYLLIKDPGEGQRKTKEYVESQIIPKVKLQGANFTLTNVIELDKGYQKIDPSDRVLVMGAISLQMD